MAAELGAIWHQESQPGMCRRQTAEEAIRARASAGSGDRSSLGQEGESYLEGLESALNREMEVREFQKRARLGEESACGHSGLEEVK